MWKWMMLAAVVGCVGAGCVQQRDPLPGDPGYDAQLQAGRDAWARKTGRPTEAEARAAIEKGYRDDADGYRRELAIIHTVNVGDPYKDFYAKAITAKLVLADEFSGPAGKVETYKLFYAPEQTFTVWVSGDRIANYVAHGFEK